MGNQSIVVYSLLGGIVPALIWLLFWLRQDAKRPEPKGRLAEAFLAGMIAVPLVLPFQKIVADIYPILGVMSFLLWAVLEESFKFFAAYFSALRSKDNNEPVDALVYMITAALGFAALENALFIWHPLVDDNITLALNTGILRFFGASLLHVLSSGAVGMFLGFAFFKSKRSAMLYGLIGLILAIVIHTAFNLFILENQIVSSWQAFGFVWISIVALLLAFEEVRKIASSNGQDII